ncbi:MAG: lipid A deacylase LpxR family protein [Chlorobi bacterium]|nr:lipid A deacylase LpxR family protein [Chlorobiota bacterium]
MLIRKKILIVVFAMITGFAGLMAQTAPDATSHILEVEWANDVWTGTDRYFTNGLELGYYNPFFRKLPSSYILLPDKKGETVYQGLTLTQHFFTPDLHFAESFTNDRPFASYLLLGHRKISLNKEKRIRKQSELQIGILGRYSGGESIQNGIHKVLPTSEPVVGWDNQLHANPALNYKMVFEHGLYNTKGFELMSLANINLGIPYTDVGGGLKMRLGHMNDYFSGFGVNNKKGWQLYFFAEAGAKYVAYNATLEGGLLYDNAYVMKDIDRFVIQSRLGLAFTMKSFGIEVGQQTISREFKTGRSHMWGYVTFRFAF